MVVERFINKRRLKIHVSTLLEILESYSRGESRVGRLGCVSTLLEILADLDVCKGRKKAENCFNPS